jgi:GAF domain-containing protein
MFARIARELGAKQGAGSTSQRVVELAKSVLGCDSTAMWSLTGPDRIRLHAASDPPLAQEFSEQINTVREGMAWECLRSRATVRVTDIRSDWRWPAYREFVLLASEPLLSAVGYSLEAQGRSLGALILASREPHFFNDRQVEIGAIFAEHAAMSLEAANSDRRVQDLEQGLESNRRIGMALGILMTRYQSTEDHAFEMLRAASQRQRQKLRDVAETVILTGSLPDSPA